MKEMNGISGNSIRKTPSLLGAFMENKLASLGDYVEARLSTMSPNKKYAMEVALRLPMMLIIHQLMLLAPYSEYTILEIPLFLLRVFGAMLMFGSQEAKKKNLFTLYFTFAIDAIAAWTIELSYWLIKNEAHGICQEDSRLSFITEDVWWIPIGVVTVILTAYVFIWNSRYQLTEEFGIKFYWLIAGYLFLHGLCTFGYFLTILAPIYYYFYKTIFFLICQAPFIIVLNEDERYKLHGHSGVQGFRTMMPGKWISRDLHSSFAVVYFCSCVIIDLYRLGMTEVFTKSYFTRFIGDWTSTTLILLSLASFLSIISNCAVAISRFLVIGNVNFRETFDVHVGSKVYIGTITLCIQAGILSGPFYQRTENMGFVLLIMVFMIVCQLWDLSEQHFLSLLNSGETNKVFAYLRVTLFIVCITTGPTYFLFSLASTNDFDVWPLMNITGVTTLVSRSLLSVVEFVLIGLSWYVNDKTDIVANAIYYIRVVKSIMLIVCLSLTSYYRLYSPFLDGPFWLTALLLVIDVILLSFMILSKEWKSFQTRRRLVQQINNIPDATPDQISEYDDDCSICLMKLESGKYLACRHIHHTECLKKWFQVKATCPKCNAVVQG